MITITKKEECCGCHACSNKCPKQCITMKVDNEGFWYPDIDKDICINCGMCEKVCPIIHNENIERKKSISYACKNNDNNVRKTSSSGGVFTLLCENVIKAGGVVFGACFDENFDVKHMYAETLIECEKFKGSKYVQSKIGNTYEQTKRFLDDGRLVLFSGTPCQISGLEAFLMKKYNNLISVDIACHGVPSPMVYKSYLEILKNKNNSEVSSLSFRDKSVSWKTYNFKACFKNNKEFNEVAGNNIYMKGFLSDIYLRPSCYDCKFKKPVTSADLTLADYWGVQNIHPEFDDDKGTSLILVNTQKGQDIFNKISIDMDVLKTDLDYALSNNQSIVRPVKRNTKREKFFRELRDNNLEKVITKYTEPDFMEKVKEKGLRILRKIKN